MSGRAIVHTRAGNAYVGIATLGGGGVISMPNAQLLHRDIGGTRTYSPRSRAWAPREWTEVEWLDGDREAVAA